MSNRSLGNGTWLNATTFRETEHPWRSPTELLCWHCCHPFANPPVPMPVNQNLERNVFQVVGNFCSLECSKAFLLDYEPHRTNNNLAIFANMSRTVFGQNGVVNAAPSRFDLKVFGGDLSLEEFRQGGRCYTLPKDLPFVSVPFVTEGLKGPSVATTTDNSAAWSVTKIRVPHTDTSLEQLTEAEKQVVMKQSKFSQFCNDQQALSLSTQEPSTAAAATHSKTATTRKRTVAGSSSQSCDMSSWVQIS